MIVETMKKSLFGKIYHTMWAIWKKASFDEIISSERHERK